ncbi:signal transducer and activator of transcription 2 [Limosa lapponica baueri]|uniref:Signal transducer and activator of transcription 2 n=1 Tax=Limosa lapponica baueri TaxID=1758121 RepID=A0A2I0TF12_LIMLA|nr:signal transducer and activator of transcription 2 [Limosa lapponica baueri]
MLQAGSQGSEPPRLLQVGSGVSEQLQPRIGDLQPQVVLQLVPEGQGTVQVGPGVVGTLHVLPEGLGMVQPVAGDVGMVQPVAGEPLLVPEGQGTLPLELRDVEPLPESLDVEELLQSLTEGLEPGSGTLETLEAAELMPDMAESMDRGLSGLDPGLANTTALLNPRDPFLPQLEDAALSPVSSLFATDFPPLHIDASDFQ